MKISLILSIYIKNLPLQFIECYNSILYQTTFTNEIIIIKDGQLTKELDNILFTMQKKDGVQILSLPKNVTQGPARAEGIKAAKNDWIAIMDSDDICMPDRFEKQIAMIEANPDLSLIGGQIAEFGEEPDKIKASRRVPITHDEIIKFAKWRNPFNTMTVMFKRDLALEAGNFRYFPGFEDYDLWARMIKCGAVCANHPDVLVKARVGSGMYGRRRGLPYIKSEWQMQRELLELGLINKAEFARNVAVRTPARLLPEWGLEKAYNGILRKK